MESRGTETVDSSAGKRSDGCGLKTAAGNIDNVI
jgi:hypothetical protein